MKRLLSLTLALCLMLAALSACSTESGSQTTTSIAEEASEAVSAEPAFTQTARESGVESALESASEMGPAAVTISYPLEERQTTFTMCYSIFAAVNNMLPNGFTDAPFYDAFEEATGVRFEIEQYDITTYTEKLQLMIVSDSLPDLVMGMLRIYTAGAAQAMEEETVLDIAPYLETCAPDYLAVIESFEGGLASLTTDDGAMGAVYELYSQDYAYDDGYFIRDDMLEATGQSAPTTLDELLDLARGMKNNGVEYPMYLNCDGDETGLLVRLWQNEWGYMNWYWDTEAEAVAYSHVQDYTMDYIKWMQGVWDEGLFLSSGASDVMGLTQSFNDFFRMDAVGIFTGKVATIDEELATLSTPTTVSALKNFTGENTEQGELPTIKGEASASITTSCEDPETLLKALNYLYTEEGSFLNEYGPGEAYELDENGEPVFSELVMNNPNVAQRFAQAYYTNPTLPGLSDPYVMSYSWSEAAQTAAEVWGSAYTGHSATFDESLITLTTEENEIINLYMSDLDTHCTETLYNFVYGGAEVTEDAFDAFVDICYNSLYLQDILDVYTAAWQRYLARV